MKKNVSRKDAKNAKFLEIIRKEIFHDICGLMVLCLRAPLKIGSLPNVVFSAALKTSCFFPHGFILRSTRRQNGRRRLLQSLLFFVDTYVDSSFTISKLRFYRLTDIVAACPPSRLQRHFQHPCWSSTAALPTSCWSSSSCASSKTMIINF